MRPVALVVLAVIITGCGSEAPNAPPASVRSAGDEPVVVVLTCATGEAEAPCAFRPAEVTIRAGGMVRWMNDDATFHTVTSSDRFEVRRPNGGFDHVLDEPGDNATVTFTEPGTYPYYCQPHAEFMAGVVRVLG